MLASATLADWKPTDIALGTWCFVGQENLPGWEKSEFAPDPFADEKDWLNAETRIDELVQKYAPAVATELNQKNGLQKSEEYWRVLTHHWLTAFFLNFVLREMIIDKAIAKYGHEELEVECLEVAGDFPFWTSNQFVYDGVNSQGLNHWIFSEILKKKQPPRWKLKWRSVQANEMFQQQKPASKYWKLKVLLFLEEFLRFRRVYGVSLWKQHLLSIPLWFKSGPRLPRTYRQVEFPSPTVSDLDWAALLRKTTPRVLLEMSSQDSQFLFFRKGLMVLCGTLLYSDEDWKVKLANFVENGGYYYTAQHGCNYGVALVHASLKWTESWRTKFLSWGWKEVQDYQLEAIPTSAPLLSNFIQKFQAIREKTDRRDIFYIGRDPNPFVYNLYPATQPNQLIRYREKKVEFFQRLKTELLAHVRYRPAPFNPVSLRDRDYIRERFPKVPISEGPFHQDMFQSKLVVCDTPGTTYHICMAANIPVIGVWSSEEYLFVRQTREHFDGLKRAGVLFEDPLQAADKVNQVYTDVDQWWSSAEIQAARKKWNDRNARHSDKWLSEWFHLVRGLK